MFSFRKIYETKFKFSFMFRSDLIQKFMSLETKCFEVQKLSIYENYQLDGVYSFAEAEVYEVQRFRCFETIRSYKVNEFRNLNVCLGR